MTQKIRLGLIAILILFSGILKAQYISSMIGVNGLTCSACTRTVEMSIRKLNFVEDVQMNLENTEGKIIFKENTTVDISKLAKAVTDAGFSVRYVNAKYFFKELINVNNSCIIEDSFNFQFINVNDKKLEGEIVLNFLGQEYQAKSEYNKIKSSLINNCNNKAGKTYFVTL